MIEILHFILGIKRKRWSDEEERQFYAAFERKILRKENVSTQEIREAQKKFPILKERSEATIRSRMNNYVLGKLKIKM